MLGQSCRIGAGTLPAERGARSSSAGRRSHPLLGIVEPSLFALLLQLLLTL